MADPIPMAPAPTGRLTKLCPHCLTENDASAHMCRQCLTPMTFFAATVPVFSVWAECDTYYKASRSPAKLIVVLGMWLLFGPWFLVCAVAACVTVDVALFEPWYRGGNVAALLLLIPLAAIGCVPVILLMRTTRKFFGRRGELGRGTPLEPPRAKIIATMLGFMVLPPSAAPMNL